MTFAQRITCTAASVLVAGGAFAADLGGKAKASELDDQAAVYSWTGLSLKLLAAQSSIHNTATLSGFGSAIVIDNLGADDLMPGIGVGLDLQYGRFVFGLDAGWLFGDRDFSVTGPGFKLALPIGDQWYAGGRVGVLATSKTLVFASLSYTEAQAGALSLTGGGSGIAFPVSTWKGWSYGGGIETAIMPNVSLAIQYSHTEFDEQTIALGGPVTLKLAPVEDRVMGSVSYRIPVSGILK